MNNLKNITRFLKIVFKKNKFIASSAFLLMITVSVLDLLIPQVTRIILDDAIMFKKSGLLLKLIIVYISITFLSSILNVILDFIYSKMKKRTCINLKIKLLNHLSKLSGNYYTNIKTGNLLSIIENDMFTVENFGADIIFSIIVDIFTAMIALFFLIKMQLDLLLIVIGIQLLLTISQIKFTNVIASETSKVRTEAGNISNLVQEYVSNIMNVVISKSKGIFFKKYIPKEKTLLKKCIKLDMIISSNIGIANILSSLIIVFTYGYGGLKIIKGQMTLGELIAFQQYIDMLIGPCMRIIRSNTRIQQSAVSINRVFNILDEPIEIEQNNRGKRYEENLKGDIIFNNVKFSYNNYENVIDYMDIKFENGKMTAIVGPSGCGKSTIVKLLYRLWDIDNGDITISGTSLNAYNLKDIRKNISIITQDLLLFDDSIFNNLTLGDKNKELRFIENICKKVGIYNFIKELPEGFETKIGEHGVKLSGGQKQRIAIARALISDCKIIVFDEATSALDNISQSNILENIKEIIGNKTVIVIAHRLSTIRDADKIYVLNKGKVVEEGTHRDLVEKEEVYWSLLNEENMGIVTA
ncbi:ABC transporter ATP-binding protein [Paeniclostridium hominis]|uniref:ABC transporter ATP-binding protein n=1 Tax=Paeniclostridium hominis TaxID=2764329 RepID=UPI0022E617CE|nr:ABC transporter ATP-binding protein [Paeniclostridium hominis]